MTLAEVKKQLEQSDSIFDVFEIQPDLIMVNTKLLDMRCDCVQVYIRAENNDLVLTLDDPASEKAIGMVGPFIELKDGFPFYTVCDDDIISGILNLAAVKICQDVIDRC